MRAINSKKGFYIVSPLLGTFFFLITVTFSSFYVTENNQMIDLSRAGAENALIFTSYTIQADAFDVYLQNYLQQVLDNYVVGASDPVVTEVTNEVIATMALNLGYTYEELYRNAFNVDCRTMDKAWSSVIMTFNGQRGIDLLGCNNPFCTDSYGKGKTAIWPYASRYALRCAVDEPPITVEIDFQSRWYYLDADNICDQAPTACH
jgi:hypothetical protein